MTTKLLNIRQIGDILCATSEDVLLGLASLKGKSDQAFIESLNNAIFEGDMDIICGHIDWFRHLSGKNCLDISDRKQLEQFYRHYFAKHKKNSGIKYTDFIVDALEHFS